MATPLAAALAIASACDDPGELKVIEGEYLDYMWDPSLTPCAGTASTVDATVPWIAALLGCDLSDLEHLEYRWLPPEVIDAIYPGDAPVEYVGGYARQGYTNIELPTSPHELVHLVDAAAETRARPHALLVEGLAVALDENPGRGGSGRLIVPLDPRTFIDGPLPSDLSFYPAAGSFVAYLLGRFGVDLFYEFKAALPSDASGERFRQEFAAVYGEELDPFIDDYLTATTCPEDALPLPLPPSCGAPMIPWTSDDVWIYRRTLTCDEPDVFGDAEGTAAHQVTLEVAADGTYDVTSFGDAWQRALLKPCAPCPWIREQVVVRGGSQRRVELAAGRYALLLDFPGDMSALAGVAVTRVADG